MSARNHSVKAALVLGTLTAGLLAQSAPAFSQVSALDRLLEQAETASVSEESELLENAAAESNLTESNLTESNLVESGFVEGSALESEQTDLADREAAMLRLAEALAADGMTDTFISAEVEVAAAVEKRPGADALGQIESVSAESIAIALPKRDLESASAAFTVDAASVPALQAALNSDQALTQLYAADALWTLTGNSDLVLPTLMQAAASEDPDIQTLAVAALGQMGDEASPAVPVLKELLNRDSRTRRIAQDALTVIRSSSPTGAVLGIISRESQRRLLPAALRAITGLWR